ncbi:hypothetical protein Tco_1109003 [Tanacetum coccineum]
MSCSLPHTDSEVETLVQKLIDEDNGRQNAIMNLALQFETSCTDKDDLRKAYEKCNGISKAAKLEKHKDPKLAWLLEKYYYRSQESVDDSDLNLTPVLRSSSSARVEPSPYTPNPVRIIPGPAESSYQTIEESVEEYKYLTEGGLTEDELHQLAKDEEALKEVLEEEAKREKENAIYN